MKQPEQNLQDQEKQQSSIAWFKLAELVNRGEKEKALTFYRLLSHSFDDKAYVSQLEGDLLWFFQDRQALEKYQHAAILYQEEKKLLSAVFVYEHLLTLEPENSDYLIKAINYYTELDWPEKFNAKFVDLINLFEQQKISSELIFDLIQNILDFVQEDKNRQKWVLKELKKITKIIPENLSEKILSSL
ncbi:MAG: hypothetical protein ABIA74_02950 [bacterium]